MMIDAHTLQQQALTTLRRLGCHEAEAAAVAEHLLAANLSGHDSHGIGMLPFYVDSCRRGTLKVNQSLQTVQDFGAILQFDAVEHVLNPVTFDAGFVRGHADAGRFIGDVGR